MKIISINERDESKMGITITKIGGKMDGESFRMVECITDSGHKIYLYKSNARDGLFKQVFVPYDFEHKVIIK